LKAKSEDAKSVKKASFEKARRKNQLTDDIKHDMIKDSKKLNK